MRKNELCGLAWKQVDLDGAQVTVDRQLTKPGAEPTFGTPKNGRSRTISITTDTVQLLKTHKKAQAELKLANGTPITVTGSCSRRSTATCENVQTS